MRYLDHEELAKLLRPLDDDPVAVPDGVIGVGRFLVGYRIAVVTVYLRQHFEGMPGVKQLVFHGTGGDPKSAAFDSPREAVAFALETLDRTLDRLIESSYPKGTTP